MKVSRGMQRKMFTVQKDEPVERAQTLMAVNNIRHLPVLEGKKLVGIISERDIRSILVPQRNGASKKKNSSYYIPGDVTVEDAMSVDPITVEPGSDIEEAARLLFTHKIGCLPVIEKGSVVGIITDTDILWVFSQIMGVLEASSRIDVILGKDPKALEKATEIIHRHKGSIISIGMHPNSAKGRKVYSFRLKSCDTGPIVAGLTQAGYKVHDEVG